MTRTDAHAGDRPLERGRAAHQRRAWDDAVEALTLADQGEPLGPEDLQRLVEAVVLSGRDELVLRFQERLYRARIEAGACLAAARVAFWMASRLYARGEAGQAGGWMSRAQRLVEREGCDCVEQGYLLLPAAQRHLAARELSEARDVAARAAEIGERFGEVDLVAFARNLQGRALVGQGQVDQGLALIDEAMLAVISGELSLLVTGLIYCSAIASCQQIYALDRAREWTAALSSWCDTQPQLMMFSGNCLIHRSEILQIGGAWPEAIEEARRASERRLQGGFAKEAAGRACYQRAEIHRLRGELAEADQAYRAASQAGVETQPGLALLRLAQGEGAAAMSSISRATAPTSDPLQRTRFLPALVEIALGTGELEAARAAAKELEETAAAFKTDVLSAIAWHARAAVRLAEGEPSAVLDPVRRAFDVWQQIGAPYLAARLRVLLACACLALGDADGARLELEGARAVFERLGARPDLDEVAKLEAAANPERRRGSAQHPRLTERELQVLRLVAAGKTNKVIARELALSEKTVDRHLSNIFTKIDVSSRAAATAYAYQHDLVS
jgi:DNA-binding CsgD family transcriptional regulator